jgi:hypothetical protein
MRGNLLIASEPLECLVMDAEQRGCLFIVEQRFKNEIVGCQLFIGITDGLHKPSAVPGMPAGILPETCDSSPVAYRPSAGQTRLPGGVVSFPLLCCPETPVNIGYYHWLI